MTLMGRRGGGEGQGLETLSYQGISDYVREFTLRIRR